MFRLTSSVPDGFDSKLLVLVHCPVLDAICLEILFSSSLNKAELFSDEELSSFKEAIDESSFSLCSRDYSLRTFSLIVPSPSLLAALRCFLAGDAGASM
jgi:hypothetical protein